MATITVIQFRVSDASLRQEQASIRREINPSITLKFLSALDETLDWHFPETIISGSNGVILGGSGDFDFDGGRDMEDPARKISYELLGKLRPLFAYLFEHDIPTLGICYGHQMLGAFAGAQVHSDLTQKKTKSHEVKLLVDTNDHFLFSGMPDSFHAHYGHKDVLDRIPDGAVLLMSGGEACKVSALQYKKNIYTVQFHPELTYHDVVERIQSSPGYLPEGATIEEIFKDDGSSNTILKNFGTFVAHRHD